VEADLVVGPLVDLVVLRPGADLQQVTAAAVRVDLQRDTAAAVRVDLQQDTAAAVRVDLQQDTAAAVRVDLQQVIAAAVRVDLQQVMAAGHLLEASQEPSFFLLPKLDWVQPVVDQEQVPWDSEAACQDPPDLERDLVLVRLALAPDCNSVLRVDQGEALRASDKAQVARGLPAVHPFRISSR
jgi:hypothetical protein